MLILSRRPRASVRRIASDEPGARGGFADLDKISLTLRHGFHPPMAGDAGNAGPPSEDEKMSQSNLFGIESYQQTRKPAKGRTSNRLQLDLFGLVKKAVQAAKAAFKRGERYYIASTGYCARFVRYIGESSLWKTRDGLIWRATRQQVESADVRPLN